MPGQYRFSIDTLHEKLHELEQAGIKNILLFGIPDHKDEEGSAASDPDGIIQRAIRYIKENFPEFYVICDLCLCEYTSHGHCGILTKDGYVDNDKSIEALAKIALTYADSGADMVAPSNMMDYTIATLRSALDEHHYETLPIMAYSAKYASAFYGPFREAAGSAPAFGDRRSYQMDYHNSKEALKEVQLDIDEGADIVMVKPALSYLDIITKVADTVDLPVAAYSVSAEYSMIKAAAAAGCIDEDNMVAETAVSIFRAGANILITYYAEKIAKFIDEGKIG
jgi:porphobilinogen synthase